MFNQNEKNYLIHYGVKHKSGRYPWGSGENPKQSEQKNKSKSNADVDANASYRIKMEKKEKRKKFAKNALAVGVGLGIAGLYAYDLYRKFSPYISMKPHTESNSKEFAKEVMEESTKRFGKHTQVIDKEAIKDYGHELIRSKSINDKPNLLANKPKTLEQAFKNDILIQKPLDRTFHDDPCTCSNISVSACMRMRGYDVKPGYQFSKRTGEPEGNIITNLAKCFGKEVNYTKVNDSSPTLRTIQVLDDINKRNPNKSYGIIGGTFHSMAWEKQHGRAMLKDGYPSVSGFNRRYNDEENFKYGAVWFRIDDAKINFKELSKYCIF